MPTCKNDPSKKYKGTEPSPKGYGWCAHGEKEGKVRKGKDGNQWIVKNVKNGSKRWMKKGVSKNNLEKIVHKGYKKYFIHDNGGRPFLVYTNNKNIYIYKIDNGEEIEKPEIEIPEDMIFDEFGRKNDQ